MISKRDLQLGKIALRAKMVTKEQLAKSLAIQKKIDKKVGLGAILLKKGYINREQLEEIVRLHNDDKNGSTKNGASGSTADAKKSKKKKKKGPKKKPGETSEASSQSQADASQTSSADASKKPDASSEDASKKPDASDASSADASKKPDASDASSSETAKKTDASDASSSEKAADASDASSSEKAADASNAKPAKKSGADDDEKPKKSKSSKTSAALADEKSDDDASAETKKRIKSKRTKAANELTKAAEKPNKRSGARDPSASESNVDASLLESAPSDAGTVDDDDPSRRVVACGECDKKYRIKKKQAGKRFTCRKCGAKVKIPKDIFDRDAKASKRTQAVAVEEFSLGSSDSTGEDDGDAPAKPARPAPRKDSTASAAARKLGSAGTATATVPKGADGSLAALAKAAIEHKAAPLAPKRTRGQIIFGYVQAALALSLVAGLIGGIFYWRHEIEQERLAKIAADKAAELARYRDPIEQAVREARALLEKLKQAPPSKDLVRELTTTATSLEQRRLPLLSLVPQPENGSSKPTAGSPQSQAPSIAYPENRVALAGLTTTLKVDELLRELYLLRGKTYFRLDGEAPIHEAAHDFAEVAAGDPKNDEALALLTRAELRRRHFAAAVEAARKAVQAKNDARNQALLGLAAETGDLIREAVKAYDAAAEKEPLARVLRARAHLADGALDEALTSATEASEKLEGESKAAAEAIRGLAYERKGDLDAAAKAFDACVTAAGSASARALCARGEHRLRTGKFQEAVADFDASLKVAGNARSALGLGDAQAGLLDAAAAKAAYTQALTLPSLASTALVAGDIDAFDDPRAPSSQATAHRRNADLALGAGRLDEARGSQAYEGRVGYGYLEALRVDPFDPETRAALARLEVFAKNTSGASDHVAAARALLASAADKSPKGDVVPVRGPSSASVLLSEALFWDARGELDKAWAAVEAALAADATTAGSTAYALRGAIYSRRGKAEQTRAEYTRSLDIELNGKDVPSRFFKLAQASFEKVRSGDKKAAEQTRAAIESVLALVPRHANALCLRGRLSLRTKGKDDPLKDFNAALEANPWFLEGRLARGFYYVRDIRADQRDDVGAEKAREDFEAAIGLEPTRADGYYGKALCSWLKGDAKATLTHLADAIKRDGSYAEAFKLRAEVYRQDRKDKEAEADEKRYQELSKRGT